ncbi:MULTISPECIES: cell division protein ZapA [Nitrospirillum]|jgi:cell division protein ZapA|uniref:Cell division protein ZapA n=1 Tax=Nitrospirillum amazonense TaxID=28077 RepID=A0A560JQX2_9PROT|nr:MULTISPECIES: cell division protein ZapA [Nitrospirillum]MDG3441985.1 cell division protein ZapA [Nitrospirillum amazonense]MEA1676793.1 cell division protein ZapA [Nitrospirillum sp. BR 11163]MEC4591105.1 cell division protein ZapA [Nitrospirillum amazonense]TWB27086.1 cell division protein ZapA [Nitrospirillum amazonense]TWB73518.1 cell division protein ZapA [Nitrospirillum amazonense]
MARVDIILNGRPYGLACDDGQEQRLRELGSYVDARLREVAHDASGGSETQLLVLTALMLADEIFDLRAELGGPRRPVPAPVQEATPAPRAEDDSVIAAVDSLAKRIEDIAARLDRS